MIRNRTARASLIDQVFFPDNRKVKRHSPVLQLGKTKFLSFFLVLAAAVATALLFVYTDLKYITLNYQISEAFSQQKQLYDLNRKLRIELTNLKSLGRLEKLAVEKYNMAPPESGQIVYLQ
ncbi:MAG: cell division protein FtsL [Desulfobacteraceae bacterium]